MGFPTCEPQRRRISSPNIKREDTVSDRECSTSVNPLIRVTRNLNNYPCQERTPELREQRTNRTGIIRFGEDIRVLDLVDNVGPQCLNAMPGQCTGIREDAGKIDGNELGNALGQGAVPIVGAESVVDAVKPANAVCKVLSKPAARIFEHRRSK